MDRDFAICQATIKVQVGEEVEHTVAEGDGPVNALDAALRRGLMRFFPRQLKPVQRSPITRCAFWTALGALLPKRAYSSNPRTDGNPGRPWSHDNIVEASLRALIDSFEYRLTRKKKS